MAKIAGTAGPARRSRRRPKPKPKPTQKPYVLKGEHDVGTTARPPLPPREARKRYFGNLLEPPSGLPFEHAQKKAERHVARAVVKVATGRPAPKHLTQQQARAINRTPLARRIVGEAQKAIDETRPKPHGLAHTLTDAFHTVFGGGGSGDGGAPGATSTLGTMAITPASTLPLGKILVKAPVNLAVVTAEHPADVAKASLRTAKESITGLPQAVKMIAEHPEEALKSIAHDYARRYGPLLNDPEKFREQVRKDYGLTPFALDVGAGAGAAGRIAGAAARTETAARAAAALDRVGTKTLSRIVRSAHEAATMERPKLRISGGEKGVRPQKTSRNLFVAAGQRAVDRSRARAFERQAGKAGLKVGEGNRLERAAEAKPGRLDALRPGPGEVTPVGRLDIREKPALRKLVGRTERQHGLRKSFERLRLLQEGGRIEREARHAIKQLDGKEKDTLLYAMELGVNPGHMEQSLEALRTYRAMIVHNRKAEGAVLPFEPDELPTIDAILSAPAEHITPKLRQVADELRALEHREAAKDPALTAERAADRRVLPQSMLLERMGYPARRAPDVAEFEGRLRALEGRLRERGIDPGDLVAKFGGLGQLEPRDRLPVVRELEKALRVEKGKAERAVATAERRAARVAAVVKERETRGAPLETPAVSAARAELAVAKRGRRTLGRAMTRQERRAGRMIGRAETKQTLGRVVQAGKQEAEAFGRQHELLAAERRVLQARQRLDAELERAPRVSEAVAARQAKAEQHVLDMRARRDDARVEHAVAAHLRGELKARPGRYESSEAFGRRVTRAAEQAGLEAPAYFESSGGAELRRSLKAIGTGIRGAADSRSYTGARFLAGRQSNDPEVIVNGLLRNAKRRFSWRFTVNTINQSAFEWSRGVHGGGLTARELRREFDRRHIDPSSVEIVNVRVLEHRELDAEGLDRGQVLEPTADDASPTGGIHPDDLAGVHEALAEARVSREQLLQEAQDVTSAGVRGQAFNRYVAIPARDYEELAAATRPDGVVGRALDILWKQKPARVMLGLANVPWLAFQVMSNGFVAGLGHALNPFDYVAAQRWWRTLTPDEKLAIEPELGITHHHHAIGEQTQLGAATNAHFVNAWRAFKQTRVMRTLHKGNPLDAMFRADEAQNNFFRRAVLYNQAKRDAYRRLGADWRSVAGAQKKLMSVLSLGKPGEVLRAVIHDRAAFEEHAAHVREFMGDYLSFTATERRTLARSAMFYGYMRFSLRLLFYTMPLKHPIVTDVLAQLGQMGSQEIKRLLGLPADATGYRAEDVPMSMLANLYFGDPEAFKKGVGGLIPIGRANPFLNSVTQLERPEQAFGLFSPIFQAEIDQVLHQSTFTGRDWMLSTKPVLDATQQPSDYFGSFFGQFHPGTARNRILLHDLLTLAYPYRLLEQQGIPGVVRPLEGPQFSDSLVFSPRPRHFKDEATRKSIARSVRAQRESENFGGLLRSILPFVGPLPTANAQVLQRELEKRAAASGTRKKKTRTRKSGGLGGGGLGGALGGSGF